MVTTGERLAVDGFGPGGRAFERELAPHKLPTGACQPTREGGVAEEPGERPRPRGRGRGRGAGGGGAAGGGAGGMRWGPPRGGRPGAGGLGGAGAAARPRGGVGGAASRGGTT